MRSSDIFYRFGNGQILPKNVKLKWKSTKTKNFEINYARYTTLKNHLVYDGSYDCYENIKIKL